MIACWAFCICRPPSWPAVLLVAVEAVLTVRVLAGHSPAESGRAGRRRRRCSTDRVAVHRALVGRRPQRREQLRLHRRPRDEQRLIQVHLERDRPAGDQRHAHVLPVLVAGVLDDGPALQRRLALLVQHQPVAGLPDGVFDDVADLHRPLSVAGEVEADGALLAVVGGGQHFQGAAELGVERRVEEAQPLHLRQRHRAHALGAQQVQHVHLDHRVLGAGLVLFLHADDDAGHRAGLGGVALLEDDLDLLAAGLVEDLAQRRVVRQVQGERLERLVHRLLAVVADGGHLAVAEVRQDQAL